MKQIRIKLLATMALSTLLFSGCKKLLVEEPRSFYEPGFFKTEKGVLGGITSQYAHLRFIYGQPYYYSTMETGTDEYTWGQSADNNFKDPDMSGVGNVQALTFPAGAIWGVCFSNINTASGIIENAAAVGTISNALIAEARFFRAFDYFLLVQNFGGVPLDLGAGDLKFNTSAVRTSKRNTVAEVYSKAIFPDLLTAINDLPATPRVTGGVSKTAARLYLAKAYLTYAWWLQNPNNIPTYPAVTTRTDPDGKDAAYYFQQAYNTAVAAIDNPGPFGLEASFYDLHVGGNDRNKEMVLYADHTQESEFYNGNCLNCFDSELGNGRNSAVWMVTPNYTVLTSASNPDGTGSAVNSVQREAMQFLGRPYVRMAPTVGALSNTFTDKSLDSRFDGTFTTAYRGNWPKGGATNTTLYNANDLPVTPGSTILSFLDDETLAPTIAYPSGNRFPGKVSNSVGAGQIPGRSDFVITPRAVSRIIFPGLWKMGVYRTDNGTGLGQPNATSTRPYKIAKFSELYLIAAEAAVKGATTVAGKSARELVNVLRARAGKWKFSNRNNAALVADNSAALTALTPATIDINYILAERSREYFGEGVRWLDLVRTQKWNELAGSFQIASATYGDHTPATVTRTIQPFHYLRPIPQAQLDGMEGTAAEKAAYQNPNY
ncbi:RagB/SusD family nutrient uptake outer membrane protein [Sediminibacterium roseum]|uniref:RagB/SusD family nutrient uptake outer membrane protein n=1 Tax=Sediminibacterium roseum TaxID=1978412 RepID=A0ABW9ZRY1_9BACT|nr:RagB/SusD family nutrient uptake outer membrane protein [Sediminibacterium roseum]NCI49859.1 RagB/SusD family nutrient uptake outer membrane protein [Sediminibacterium roseum]